MVAVADEHELRSFLQVSQKHSMEVGTLPISTLGVSLAQAKCNLITLALLIRSGPGSDLSAAAAWWPSDWLSWLHQRRSSQLLTNRAREGLSAPRIAYRHTLPDRVIGFDGLPGDRPGHPVKPTHDPKAHHSQGSRSPSLIMHSIRLFKLKPVRILGATASRSRSYTHPIESLSGSAGLPRKVPSPSRTRTRC